MKIKNLVFDLGGVVFHIDREHAVQCFKEVGVEQADVFLDPFEQKGIFGDLEAGRISDEEFRVALSRMCGHELSWEDCRHGWKGYFTGIPDGNLDMLERLRREGYRMVLLSNTNPYMMSWARSTDFDGRGNPLDHYFDALYLSYECRVMKPHRRIFEMMLHGEGIDPDETIFIDDSRHNTEAAQRLGIHTYCPASADEWQHHIHSLIKKLEQP
ncbi:MAG: HAD family phosphatase [Muribaculaceae bacterium]|nr:HAD family phosphatase [Muribaculaceae bacterium]